MGAIDRVEWSCVLCGRCVQNEQVELWICVKVCIKLEHSSAETIWVIQKAFGDNAMSAAQIKVWHKCLKDCWESVESDPHFGRPTTRTPENIEHVQVQSTKIGDWQCEN